VIQASVITELQAAPKLEELPLVEFSVGEDPRAVARLALPVSAETESQNTLVYLEVDPGYRIPLHTHSSEEIFVVLAGEGIVTAGEEQWTASAGAIAVAPAFMPHGWENTAPRRSSSPASSAPTRSSTSSRRPSRRSGSRSSRRRCSADRHVARARTPATRRRAGAA
jgi:quercetin dioxygenase-like cupin family protein